MSVKKLQTVQDRLPIYEEVLSFLKSGKNHPIWETPTTAGLCILLACAWNNICWEQDFRDSYGDEFHYTETFIYFPEVCEYYDSGCTRYCKLYLKDPITWRIKILEEIIKKYK